MLQTRDSPTSALLSGLSFSIRYNVLCTSRGCSCFDAEYTAESDCTVRHQNWCDFATIELDINFHGSKLFSVGWIIVRVPGEISLLFNKYEEVFTIPTTLHPERNFNHRLPLKEGTLPIQTIPYKYPLTRKEAIGVMIRELFDPRGKRVYVISVTTSRSEYDVIWKSHIDMVQSFRAFHRCLRTNIISSGME
ncbi:hypothetical protein Tco_0070676 [Tanacetum coccineum]